MFNFGKTWTCFWRVSLRYKASKDESNQERRDRLVEEKRLLKEAGIDQTEWIFKFRNTDPKKINNEQKRLAEKQAARIIKKTGVQLEVNEGSYL